ncbi:16S rRNA (cytidine(1402)-2'-O)-methyltransferase [Sulfurihydrogenibium subterraneum]|uniref:16S rRNA (cytidine(1402)-2'-O)-methyltransferase n=1 Tax=Sulfurihydrogenibium subterraneum TaxID=171121 RepID=UPI00048D8E10|nr:16S rRNA (cytidine(1402)-2'-O)-methyltransferase [Sulfurihydrogenibium subterraneum]
MGKLYVVATPIGNLKDITFRALEVLKSVDVIAAEDTRHIQKLLNHYGIYGKKLISYHDYNEEEKSEKLIEILKIQDVALVSDAGTPCISDPGYRIVKKARENNIEVVPIPGAFAGAVALSVSGLPSDKFLFVGFLPNKETEREENLKHYIDIGFTFILYESPKRVLKTLKTLEKVDPLADVVVAKELTKIHESFFTGKPENIIKFFEENPDKLKGEFVILVHPNKEKVVDMNLILTEAKQLKNHGMKTKEISSLLSQKYKVSKKEIYKKILNL